ncbi:hypothetical protein GCM10010505_62260 [Kitasatospora aburaviensis]
MTGTYDLTGVAPESISPARLQGKACIDCGTVESPLIPAGHRYTPTGSGQAALGWAVVVCAACRSAEDPEVVRA